MHASEVAAGERFAFGENWSRFLGVLDEDKIQLAVQDLVDRFTRPRLDGLTFLDLGCGSGLSSLAARRLGARVVSIDFDPRCVACATELRRRYFPDDANWTIREGSALDADMLRSLGSFDIVYSWGVLHHTGKMWEAIENTCELVKPGGTLYISIYNDQGAISRLWTRLKQIYNRLPEPLRLPYTLLVMGPREVALFAYATLDRQPMRYFRNWREQRRGMSRWHDIIDWIGGYPFEVAKPEEIFAFATKRGFSLTGLTTAGGNHGCNNFVFVRAGAAPAAR